MKRVAFGLTVNADVSRLSTRVFEGRTYLVSPCIMVKEGVLNGKFVSGDELKMFHNAWNGSPIVIDHPKQGGTHVSANSPAVLERQCVGRVFSTKFEANALHSELWIDIEKCKTLGGEALQAYERVAAGQPLEGSTAFFASLEEKGGVFNGKGYTGIWHGLRPDHYALLPNSTGACSWSDGCGVPRINADESKREIEALVINCLRNAGIIKENSMKKKDELIAALVACAASGFTQDDATFLATKTDEQLAQIAVNAGLDCGCDEAKKTADAAKAAAKKATDDAALAANKKDEKKDDAAPQTFEQQLDAMPESPLKAQMLQMLATQASEKDALVAALVANKACKLSKTDLDAMGIPTLKALHESFAANSSAPGGSANFAGRGLPRVPAANAKQDEPLPPPPSIVTNTKFFDKESQKSA